MIVGARVHDFKTIEASVTDKCNCLMECGFGGIQLAPAKVVSTIKDIHHIRIEDIVDIKKQLDVCKCPIIVYGCYIQPALEDEALRRQEVDTFVKNLGYAKMLGAKIVGTETTHFPLNGEGREAAYQRLVQSVRVMVQEAECLDLIVAIEPTREHVLNSAKLTRRLLDEIQSSHLKIILDAADFVLPNEVEQQAEIFEEVFQLLGKDIVAAHVKNYIVVDGKKQWVPLDQGVVNFDYVIPRLIELNPELGFVFENTIRSTDEQNINSCRNYENKEKKEEKYMKIALMNENSQAAKNGVIETALRNVVDQKGFEVVNYGMYGADDPASLTYVQLGILAATLLNGGACDYVITGCGTGEGAMLALNSFPNVICGHIEDPLDAYTFTQINDGNAVAIPFAKGYGWGGELNLEYIFEKLFIEEGGLGYPRERAVFMKQNREILNQVRSISLRDFKEILVELPRDLVKGAFAGENFQTNFFADCKDDQLKEIVKGILGE